MPTLSPAAASVGIGAARKRGWEQRKVKASLTFKPLCVCAHVPSYVQLFATLRTVALQAPLSMGFPRQEDWSGLPFPPPGDLPDPGIETTSLVSPALADGFFTS